MNPGIFKQKKFLFVVIVVLVLVSVGGYYYFQYQKTQKLLKDPTKAGVVQTQALIDRIGKLIELPKEEPRIATVSDKTKLAGQSFFVNAQNGDKVLIYTLAKKAILYRPSTNKIIDVAPLTVAKPTTEPVQVQATVSATVTPTVVKKSASPTPASNAADATPTATQ